MSFTIGSLFDGSGGFPLAAFMCKGTPVWASEVEPYPIAVTKTRFPYMKHLGSVTDIKGNEVEPVDVITFGSPCQDLSVAGKRAGLKHTDNGDDETTRSGLFMEAVRIIKEMREATGGKYPRFALWENVPGAFSSNKGEDFRVVCEELIKVVEPTAVMPAVPQRGWNYEDYYCGDGWSLAYRVLDAQYWGVPQRRRRIYLVLDLRGERAGEVLFERKGLRGYFAEGRTPWQAVTRDAESGSGTADCEGNGVIGTFQNTGVGWWNESAVGATLRTPCGGDSTLANVVCYAIDQQGGKGGANYAVDVMPTICSDSHGTPHAVAYGWPLGFRPENTRVYEETATTICNGTRPGFTNGVIQPVVDAHILDDQGGSQISVRSDGKCPTLRAEAHGNVPCVLESAGFEAGQSMAGGIGYQDEVAATLAAQCSGTEPTVCIKEALPFDTTQVTSPMNYSNPKWGDPCHPLAAGAHPPAVVCKCYDARGNGDGSIAPTITGDHNNRVTDYTSVVVEGTPVYCLQGNGIDRADTAGCNGKGVKEDVCYTLNTIDRPAVAYLASGKNATGTLMASASEKMWLGNQEAQSGDYHIIEEHPVCGVDCRNATEYPELTGTLQAKPGGGFSLNCNQVVRVRYIVRRLTPTECARLQGFPDGWGHPDRKDSFTEEEYEFWLNVRNTHAEINGKATKEYTKDQMLTWYNKLHTDSAEYKLWGNGIALPTALYVMQGIAEVLK